MRMPLCLQTPLRYSVVCSFNISHEASPDETQSARTPHRFMRRPCKSVGCTSTSENKGLGSRVTAGM